MAVAPASLAALAVFAVIILVVPALLITFWSPKHGRYGKHGRSYGFDENSAGLPSTAGGRYVPGSRLDDIDYDDDEDGGPGGEGARRSDRHRKRWKWWRSVKQDPAATLSRTLSQRRRFETVGSHEAQAKPHALPGNGGPELNAVNRVNVDRRRPSRVHMPPSEYAQRGYAPEHSYSWRGRQTRVVDPWSMGVPLRPLDLERVDQMPLQTHQGISYSTSPPPANPIVPQGSVGAAQANFELSPAPSYNSSDQLKLSAQAVCTETGANTFEVSWAARTPSSPSLPSSPDFGAFGQPHHFQSRAMSPNQSFGQVATAHHQELQRHFPQPISATVVVTPNRVGDTARPGDDANNRRSPASRSSSGKKLSFPIITPGPWAARSPSNGSSISPNPSTQPVQSTQQIGATASSMHAPQAPTQTEAQGQTEGALAQQQRHPSAQRTPFAAAAGNSPPDNVMPEQQVGVLNGSEWHNPAAPSSVTAFQQHQIGTKVPQPRAGLETSGQYPSQITAPSPGAAQPTPGFTIPRPRPQPIPAGAPHQRLEGSAGPGLAPPRDFEGRSPVSNGRGGLGSLAGAVARATFRALPLHGQAAPQSARGYGPPEEMLKGESPACGSGTSDAASAQSSSAAPADSQMAPVPTPIFAKMMSARSASVDQHEGGHPETGPTSQAETTHVQIEVGAAEPHVPHAGSTTLTTAQLQAQAQAHRY